MGAVVLGRGGFGQGNGARLTAAQVAPEPFSGSSRSGSGDGRSTTTGDGGGGGGGGSSAATGVGAPAASGGGAEFCSPHPLTSATAATRTIAASEPAGAFQCISAIPDSPGTLAISGLVLAVALAIGEPGLHPEVAEARIRCVFQIATLHGSVEQVCCANGKPSNERPASANDEHRDTGM